MTKARTPFWNSDDQKQYRSASDRATQAIEDRRRGEHTAAALDDIWAELSDEQRAFMELLVLVRRRTVIALYDDALFNSLAERELLQPPPGVGTLLMQKLETAYRVPPAVWQKLLRHQGDYFASAEETGDDTAEDAGDDRLAQLNQRFGARIEALVAEPMTDGTL